MRWLVPQEMAATDADRTAMAVANDL